MLLDARRDYSPISTPPPTKTNALRVCRSWTYLPGLQFLLAGVCGKTAAFFGVPAMRLALDVLVYMGVVTVFVLKVVVLKDASTITPWEVLWLVYIVGAIWKQVRGR